MSEIKRFNVYELTREHPRLVRAALVFLTACSAWGFANSVEAYPQPETTCGNHRSIYTYFPVWDKVAVCPASSHCEARTSTWNDIPSDTTYVTEQAVCVDNQTGIELLYSLIPNQEFDPIETSNILPY